MAQVRLRTCAGFGLVLRPPHPATPGPATSRRCESSVAEKQLSNGRGRDFPRDVGRQRANDDMVPTVVLLKACRHSAGDHACKACKVEAVGRGRSPHNLPDVAGRIASYHRNLRQGGPTISTRICMWPPEPPRCNPGAKIVLSIRRPPCAMRRFVSMCAGAPCDRNQRSVRIASIDRHSELIGESGLEEAPCFLRFL